MALHVERSLALLCEDVELNPSGSVLGEVVVVKMENLFVHKSPSKLSIQPMSGS